MDEFQVGERPSFSPKYELIQGIQKWVAERLRREKVFLSTMDRMNWDEIILIAGAMGYRPRSDHEKRVLALTLDAHRLNPPTLEGGK